MTVNGLRLLPFVKCIQKLFSSVCVGPSMVFPVNHAESKVPPLGEFRPVAVQKACPPLPMMKSFGFVGVRQFVQVVKGPLEP